MPVDAEPTKFSSRAAVDTGREAQKRCSQLRSAAQLHLLDLAQRSYLGIGKDTAEDRSQMSPECQSVHNEVFLPGRQLHKAGEALKAPIVMVLQINCNLFCSGEVLNHGL